MATTINAYSVSLGLDASSYIRNSELSRQETNALKRDINAARTPADRYSMSVDRLDKALRTGAISQRTYNVLLADAKRKHDAAARASKGHTDALGSMKRQIAGAAAAYVSFGAGMRAGKWAFNLAAEAEQAQVAFEVLTKDVKVASELLNSLRSFSASTPFRQSEIINSGRTLLAFGFTANEVTKRLNMMGNISAATGTRIEDLAEIIGKMRVQGRIMSEDINQLTGRGINVIDGLAERLRITPDLVKDAASKGKIAFEDLLAVLNKLAENDFGGMIAKQSETAAGKLSTLSDKVDELGRSLGNLGTNSGFLDWLIKQTDQAGKGVGLLANIYGGKDPRQLQAEAEAEEFESAQLLRDLRAGRNTPRVREIRESGQDQIASRIRAEKTAEENANRATREVISEQTRQNRAHWEEMFKRLGIKTPKAKEEEQVEELRRMRAEWAKLQESQTMQIVTAITENAFRRIR